MGGESSLDWDQHINGTVDLWRRHTVHWLAARCPILCVRYEDLVHEPQYELARLLDWLGLPRDADQTRAAVAKCDIGALRQEHGNIGEKFFRRGTVGDGLRSFSDAQQEEVREALGALMGQFGYAASFYVDYVRHTRL